MKKAFRNVKFVLILLVAVFLCAVFSAFASPLYTPGETLNPACAPGATDCTVLPMNIGDEIGFGTQGSLLFVDSSGDLNEDNANLFWDNATNRLGIGMNSPAYRLDIATTVSTPSSVGSAVNLGGGQDDLTSGGIYTGLYDDNIYVYIEDASGNPDIFAYTSDSGDYSGAGVAITAGTITLDDGVTITFGAVDGHDETELWQIELTATVVTSSSGDFNFGGGIYRNGSLWSGVIGGRVQDVNAGSVLFADTSGNLDDDTSFTYSGSTNILAVDNISLPVTSSTAGVLYRSSSRFLHSYGTDNTFLGALSGNLSLTTGSAVRNTSVGARALDALTTGDDNVAIGSDSLGSNQTGVDNTAVGMNSLIFNVSGNSNAALGRLALQRNTGSNNVGVGASSFQLKGAGDYNVGVGFEALYGGSTNYSASYNVGVGYQALAFINTGAEYNVGIGATAGGGILTGDLNVFVGYGAGDSTTSGASNVIMGADAAAALNTGGENTIIGENAAATLQTGSRNIIIGESIDVLASGTSDFLSIGNVIYGDLATDFIGLGDSTPDFRLDVEGNTASSYAASFLNDGNATNRFGVLVSAGQDAGDGTLIQFNDGDGTDVGEITFSGTTTTYGTSSDRRMKDDIVDTHYSLQDLLDIQVHDFTFKGEDTGRVYTGFIAQELIDIYPDAVFAPNDGRMWSVDYGKITPVIVRGVQELNLKVEDLASFDFENKNSLLNKLLTWFADAANGIQTFFAGEIHTNRLCVGETCVTEEEFLNLINQNNNVGVEDLSGDETLEGESVDPTTDEVVVPPDNNEIPTDTPEETNDGETVI